jgi:hypothetical protein
MDEMEASNDLSFSILNLQTRMQINAQLERIAPVNFITSSMGSKN